MKHKMTDALATLRIKSLLDDPGILLLMLLTSAVIDVAQCVDDLVRANRTFYAEDWEEMQKRVEQREASSQFPRSCSADMGREACSAHEKTLFEDYRARLYLTWRNVST